MALSTGTEGAALACKRRVIGTMVSIMRSIDYGVLEGLGL